MLSPSTPALLPDCVIFEFGPEHAALPLGVNRLDQYVVRLPVLFYQTGHDEMLLAITGLDSSPFREL